MMRISVTDCGRSPHGLVSTIPQESLEHVGVVVALVKLGCHVPIDALDKVRVKLLEELPSTKDDNRRFCIGHELGLINEALSNDDCVPLSMYISSEQDFVSPFHLKLVVDESDALMRLKLGHTVPLEELSNVRKKLVDEEERVTFFTNITDMLGKVYDEIALVDLALENEGKFPQGPIGLGSIGRALMNSSAKSTYGSASSAANLLR